MKIDSVDYWVLRAPISDPVRSAFGAMRDRPAVFVRITADDGAWGWGEVFCNFPQVGAEHRGRLIDSIFRPLVLGFDSANPPGLRTMLDERTHRMMLQCGEAGPFAQIIAAFDLALWDMGARRAGLPLWQLLRGARGPQPTLAVYASGLGPEQVGAMALAQWRSGFRAFKLKVGFPGDTDTRNLEQLRAALGPEAVIMVDANQSWSIGEAPDRIAAMKGFSPYWVEEPIAADQPLSAWRDLAQRCATPLAAGENIRGLAQFDAALSNGHLKFVQPDVAKWGGVSGCMEVARHAERRGIVYCPHWLGGGIGLAASCQMRAAIGPGGYVEVDSNPNPLRDELFPPLLVTDGCVVLSDRPGIGVEPDVHRMQPYCVAH